MSKESGLDKSYPADRTLSRILKAYPTSPENCERTYEQRGYSNEQLVEKNYKQKQKSIAADTRAFATLGATMNDSERRGYKRMGTSRMLEKRGVAEKPMDLKTKVFSALDGLFGSK